MWSLPAPRWQWWRLFLLINKQNFFFPIYILSLLVFTIHPSTSSYRSSSCPAAIGCSQLCFRNFTSTRHREPIILYSLYPISGSCSFSKVIACCITCHRNGAGSFSFISPGVSFLNSKLSLYPATLRGLVSYSLYQILLVIWILAHAIAISVLKLPTVFLSFPYCSLSLWKHFISNSFVHNCTWCCTTWHTRQCSVSTSFWCSFSIFPAPFAPSLHFRNAFSLLQFIFLQPHVI